MGVIRALNGVRVAMAGTRMWPSLREPRRIRMCRGDGHHPVTTPPLRRITTVWFRSTACVDALLARPEPPWAVAWSSLLSSGSLAHPEARDPALIGGNSSGVFAPAGSDSALSGLALVLAFATASMNGVAVTTECLGAKVMP